MQNGHWSQVMCVPGLLNLSALVLPQPAQAHFKLNLKI